MHRSAGPQLHISYLQHKSEGALSVVAEDSKGSLVAVRPLAHWGAFQAFLS